jgi:peptidoglycan hydrolase-like protein with peptidoglycan-binding domain
MDGFFDDLFDEVDLDILGADAVVTIPTAGANYTDAKTIAAVQSALVKKGYDLGTSGPSNDGVDGMFGPKTKTAIKKMQGDAHLAQTGIIDEGVIMALRVTPGVLPPGVSIQGRAAVQAQVALDAATAVEHATSGASDVQSDYQLLAVLKKAAQEIFDVAPPELKPAAQQALVKANAASTPAQAKAAATEIHNVGNDVYANVKPSWWTEPAWSGGWPRWQAGAVGTGIAAGLGALIYGVTR